MSDNETLIIIMTALSMLFIVISFGFLVFLPISDRAKYRTYLTFMREDVDRKTDADSSDGQDKVREWYNNTLMLSRYSKLPNRHRVFSAYQVFLIFFVIGVILAFIPFGFIRNAGKDFFSAFFETIFISVRSFFWGSSFGDLRNLGDLGNFEIFYMRYMSVVFVAAGLVVTTSIFKLFKEFFAYFSYWNVHPLSDIYVFSKLNYKSIALAEDVFKNKKPIKTIKRKSLREKDIEQTVFYIEKEYEFNLNNKNKIGKTRKEIKIKKDNAIKDILSKEVDEAKNSCDNCLKELVAAWENYYYCQDTTKQNKLRENVDYIRKKYKDKREQLKLAHKKRREIYSNIVESGRLHAWWKFVYGLKDLCSFLTFTLAAISVSVLASCIYAVMLLLYLVAKPVCLLFNDKCDNFWKLLQASMTEIMLAMFAFFDDHSKWFDSLFHKRRIYFCDVYPQAQDRHDELIDRANYIGATVMKRDVTELRMKWWCRSRTIYLIGNDDNENIEQAAYLHNACTRSETQNRILNNGRTEIYVFASNHESEFVIDDLNSKTVNDRVDDVKNGRYNKGKIDKKSFDIMRIRRVNEFNSFVTNFFWRRFDEFFGDAQKQNGTTEINVALIGCGKYGREFVKTLCCLGQLPNYKLSVRIFDRNIDKIKAILPQELLDNVCDDDKAQVGRPVYNITFEQCFVDVYSANFLNGITLDYTHVFVMLGDDELNVRVAMLLRTKFRREKSDDGQPLIYAIVRDYQRDHNFKQGEKLVEYDIRPIGRTIARYSERAIQQKYIERWAKVVHTSFFLNDKLSEALTGDNERSLNECFKQWRDKLPESVFKLLKNNAEVVLNVAYLVFLHSIYRSWRKTVANNIKYIDLNNVFEIRHLISMVLENMQVSDKNIASYKKVITDLVNKGKAERDKINEATINTIVQGLLEEILSWRTNFKQSFNDETLIGLSEYYDFECCEYYRRSSKSRALYERILFGLNMIECAPGEHSVTIKFKTKQSLLSEMWDEIKSTTHYEGSDMQDEDFRQIIRRTWETAQWLYLNDLMQRRWMAFMYGEGYTYKPDYEGDAKKRTDAVEKTHKYLKPYVEIYRNTNDRIRQTMEIIKVEE